MPMTVTELYREITNNQIEKARLHWEKWKRLPVLAMSVREMESILRSPEKYQVVKEVSGEIVSLADLGDEAKNGYPIPLSSVAFIYNLPAYQNGTVYYPYLKVEFYLSKPALIEGCFEHHIALVFKSKVDDLAIEMPYALDVIQGANGLTFQATGIRTSAGRKQIESTIAKISTLVLKPTVIKCHTWSGIKGEIQPLKTSSPFNGLG